VKANAECDKRKIIMQHAISAKESGFLPLCKSYDAAAAHC